MKMNMWESFLGVWLNSQTRMRHLRWKRFQKIGAREQNCLQHAYSIGILGKIVVDLLKKYLPILDEVLIALALAVHDLGEGELGNDVHWADKTDKRDAAEYEAFCRRYQYLSADILLFYKRAFLLQFCLKNPECFPPEAREIMAELAKTRRNEALVFMATEYLDYFLYVLEQHLLRGLTEPLADIVRVNTKEMDYLAEHLPGFREEIWTDKVRQTLQEFLEENKDKKDKVIKRGKKNMFKESKK